MNLCNCDGTHLYRNPRWACWVATWTILVWFENANGLTMLSSSSSISSCSLYYHRTSSVHQLSRRISRPSLARPLEEEKPIEKSYVSDLKDDNGDAVIEIAEVDVRQGVHKSLVYNPSLGRYEHVNLYEQEGGRINMSRRRGGGFLWSLVVHTFLPISSVTDSYYRYVRWRVLQRYINAVVHVLGTRSLLMGLGYRSTRIGIAGASTAWVCKDALGKVTRMAWAGRMGGRFDSDAKRWRYRSSLVFALGNFLEICAAAYPQTFLLWATLSHTCKQISMLTSSATRNALYNTFSRSDDAKGGSGAKGGGGGGGQNIGDITAKGEAQIAVVDLVGIASGILLTRIIGAGIRNVLMAWTVLQACEILCMYQEIRSVVFRVLNFERMWNIVEKFVSLQIDDELDQMDAYDGRFGEPSSLRRLVDVTVNPTSIREDVVQETKKQKKWVSFYSLKEQYKREALPTPDQMAQREKVFWPAERLARRSCSFGSFGRTLLEPDELASIVDIFKGDKFLLVVGENRNRRTRRRRKRRRQEDGDDKEDDTDDIKEHCHVVLHRDASNVDIVKSTLALAILRHCLAATHTTNPGDGSSGIGSSPTLRTRECLDLLRFTKAKADEWSPTFLKTLQARGWATPARYLFGKVTRRADWPISGGRSKNTGPTNEVSSVRSNSTETDTMTHTNTNTNMNTNGIHIIENTNEITGSNSTLTPHEGKAVAVNADV